MHEKDLMNCVNFMNEIAWEKIMNEDLPEINSDNYFDIAETIHSLLTLWHDGKKGYELLCRSQFRPGMGYRESDCEEYECYQEIKALIENEKGEFLGYEKIEQLMDNLDEFLEEKEDD